MDGDGWVDIYVGNLADEDFRTFTNSNHPGHYNMLYRNNGDFTFKEVSEQAGVRGPQVLMRTPDGEPIVFEDPETGETYEGYDPTVRDNLGNRVGEPTGQTHAVLFFDYDDDGDRLHVYRNDSSVGEVRFTPVARRMGIDTVGSWMGFSVADYDSDSVLDVFVANVGPPTCAAGRLKLRRAAPAGTTRHFRGARACISCSATIESATRRDWAQ